MSSACTARAGSSNAPSPNTSAASGNCKRFIWRSPRIRRTADAVLRRTASAPETGKPGACAWLSLGRLAGRLLLAGHAGVGFAHRLERGAHGVHEHLEHLGHGGELGRIRRRGLVTDAVGEVLDLLDLLLHQLAHRFGEGHQPAAVTGLALALGFTDAGVGDLILDAEIETC